MTTTSLENARQTIEAVVEPYVVTLREFVNEGGVIMQAVDTGADGIKLTLWVSDDPDRIEQIAAAFPREELLTEEGFAAAVNDLKTLATPWSFVGEELTLIKEGLEEAFPGIALTLDVKDFSPCRQMLEERRDLLLYSRA